jgi:hypothetical protein
MPSKYLMQVLDRKTGEVVQFEPGLSVEREFVDDCVAKIVSLGVGFFRTSAHVEQDVRDGIEQVIHELKAKVRP